MEHFDLCMAWNWEYDAHVAEKLSAGCREKGLSCLTVTCETVDCVVASLQSEEISFSALWDRASDTDVAFIPISQRAQERHIYQINPRERAVQIWNKGRVHYELINAGVHTPHTIILPSYEQRAHLPAIDLKLLGDFFIIKPAHGGGGEGVVLQATTQSQVLIARQEHPSDQYLLQAHITPVLLDGSPAWFRIICGAGTIYPCWWDTATHVYRHLSADEETRYGLAPLRDCVRTIERIFGLQLFSTEIALTAGGTFVVVDYINDQIDLRFKSRHHDGVPDDIVHGIISRIITRVEEHARKQQ